MSASKVINHNGEDYIDYASYQKIHREWFKLKDHAATVAELEGKLDDERRKKYGVVWEIIERLEIKSSGCPDSQVIEFYRELMAARDELKLQNGELQSQWNQMNETLNQAIIDSENIAPRIRAERDELKARLELALKSLEVIYDKYELGDTCYEDPENQLGHLGNAVKLTAEEEADILKALPSTPKGE